MEKKAIGDDTVDPIRERSRKFRRSSFLLLLLLLLSTDTWEETLERLRFVRCFILPRRVNSVGSFRGKGKGKRRNAGKAREEGGKARSKEEFN